jgi:peptidyl-prolyl cis-trans isomerase A (cyclophilin A)
MRRIILCSAFVLGAIALISAQTAAPKPAAPKPAAPKPAAAPNRLLNPAALNAKAPELYKVKFDTSKGVILMEVHRDWAPLGADRIYNLTRNGFFNGSRFFRVIHTFMVQFGINGNPDVTAAWEKTVLKDDPKTMQSNIRGFVTYGNTGRPNSRGTQIFINYKDNSFLDAQGFVPFGKVVEGMEVADMLSDEYGTKPQDAQYRISTEGNKFLLANFPKLDYIKTATVEK